MPWLRPLLGVFSCVTGIMYAFAAAVFYLIFIIMRGTNTENDENREVLERGLIESTGISEEAAAQQITNSLELNTFSYQVIGDFLPLVLALVAGIALLIFGSGVGLFLKKNWAIPLGRLGSVSLIVVIVGLLIFYQPAIAAIAEKRNMLDPVEGFQPFGWMAAIRYIFLSSMCPVALILAFSFLIKQYQQPEQESSVKE